MSIYDQIVYDDIEDEGGSGCPAGPPPDAPPSPFIEVPVEPPNENIEFCANLVDRETGAVVGVIFSTKPRRRSLADILLKGDEP